MGSTTAAADRTCSLALGSPGRYEPASSYQLAYGVTRRRQVLPFSGAARPSPHRVARGQPPPSPLSSVIRRRPSADRPSGHRTLAWLPLPDRLWSLARLGC